MAVTIKKSEHKHNLSDKGNLKSSKTIPVSEDLDSVVSLAIT